MRNLTFFLIASVLVLSGCRKEAEKPVKEKPSVVEVEEREVVEKPHQYPLTGLPIDEEVTERSIAVTISNSPEARPQTGLTQADWVFEFYAEGSTTRFLALFQSEEAGKIGPIRSARKYFIDTAKGYGSFYVAHGYSIEAERMLTNREIDHINGMAYDRTLFQRSSDRVAPHNSYISFEDILLGAEKVDASMKGETPVYQFLNEEELAAFGEVGEKATVVFINYQDSTFSPTYRYDKEMKKYERFVREVRTEEKETGDPVQLDNILILEMPHGHSLEKASLRTIDVEAGGNGYLLQHGRLQRIEWQNIDGKITPMLNDQEVKLVPGKTWVNVIPSQPGLDSLVKVDE